MTMDPSDYRTFLVRGHGSKDNLGYFVAFRPASSHKSESENVCHKKVYHGKKRGCGSLSEESVVVKVLGQRRTTEERCDQELEAAAKVKTLARRFSREEVGGDVKLEVLVPGKAQVDKLSKFNKKKERPLQVGEWVLVEDELPGKFRQFTDKFGKSEVDEATALETFAHFCYHVTQGELVVCGLQGVRKEDHFHLVSPTVHSVQQSYGPCDKGKVGVARFFKNHVCSKKCQDWLRPEKQGRPLERPLTPSAPIANPGDLDWERSGGSDHNYFRWDCYWVSGSPPPAYDWRYYGDPPAYEELYPTVNT